MTLLPTKPNQTRPNPSNAPTKKGNDDWTLTHTWPKYTKLWRWLRVVWFLAYTKRKYKQEKNSNIYREAEGEKYHQDYRYTGMGASMMSYIWQKMNSNWVIHGETLRWALIHMKMILTYKKLIKLCTCINLLNGEIYHKFINLIKLLIFQCYLPIFRFSITKYLSVLNSPIYLNFLALYYLQGIPVQISPLTVYPKTTFNSKLCACNII